jgi:hypothetical protein
LRRVDQSSGGLTLGDINGDLQTQTLAPSRCDGFLSRWPILTVLHGARLTTTLCIQTNKLGINNLQDAT